MANHLFRVVSDPSGVRGKVQINGRDIPAVRGYTVAHTVEDGSAVTVSLSRPDVHLNLTDATVTLSEDSARALEDLGWTRAEFIQEVRQIAAEAAQEAQSAREALGASESAAEDLRQRVAALEAENAELRRMRTSDAAELQRLRNPAPAGEEA